MVASLSKEDEIKLIKSGRIHAWALPDAGHAGLNPLVSLLHRTAITTRGGDESNVSIAEANGPVYQSDTGEVVWDMSNPEKGIILVNTSRSIAIIGFGGGRRFDFGKVIIRANETFLNSGA